MCTCHQLETFNYYEERPADFEATLVHVASGFLVKLWRCTDCGALWRIDDFDKYQQRMIVRVPDLALWETFNDRSARIALLARSRGGLTDVECIWSGCTGKSVRDSAYCAEHLFETGARR